MWVRDAITAIPVANKAVFTHECMETKLGTTELMQTSTSGHVRALQASFSHVCGFTGGMWKRLKTVEK